MCSLLLSHRAWAQTPPACAEAAPACNLIWNGSFEQTVNGGCPGPTGGFGNRQTVAPNEPATPSEAVAIPGYPPPPAFNNLACKWQDGNNVATADLYNVCSTSAEMRIPCNTFTGCGQVGYAATGQPTRTGNGYAGLFATSDLRPNFAQPDYREYIGQDMTLVANKRYYVEFYTSIAATSDWSVPRLGVAFAPTTTQYSGSGPIFLTPVIEKPVGTTPGNWQLVNGYFTATGQEQRLLIGNFGPAYSSAPGAPPTHGTGPGIPNDGLCELGSYYFIDDVLLLPVPTAGTNTTTCGQPVQLGDCPLPASAGVTYAWSPTTGLSNPSIANPVLTPSTTPGIYIYTLTVTIPGQAPQVTSVQVRVPGPVTVTATPGTVCQGSAATLTASGGDGVNYTWSPATGLSSTTGQTVVATASSTIRYVVSSTCGAPGELVLEVVENCCRREQLSDRLIYLQGGDRRYPYTTSPFTAGPGAVYYAASDLYLAQDVFQLEPGSVLLLEKDVNIHLSDHGSLELLGATLTAACRDMWGGLYVYPDADAIQSSQLDAYRSAIEHSQQGVVLLDDVQPGPGPQFSLTGTDFRQNLQSVEVRRRVTQASSRDRIMQCTFDSAPKSFLDPQRYVNSTDYTSALRHVAVDGQLLPATIADNDFANAYFGVEVVVVNGPTQVELTGNRFRDFWIGGAYGGIDKGNLSSLLSLRQNTFTFPAAEQLPPTPQTSAVLTDHTPTGSAAATTGGYLELGRIRSWRDTFQQLDSLIGNNKMENYADFGQYRPRQVGLHAPEVPSAHESHFYLLDTGIEVMAMPTGDNTDIKGNGFANCRVGLWASTRQYDANNQPALNASCNTFRRDNYRSGTSTGIYTHLPQLSIVPPGGGSIQYYWSQIRIQDERPPVGPNQPFPVRNLFDDGGLNGSGNAYFVAINNTSPTYTIGYKTFDLYTYDYDNWSSANVNVTGAGVNVNTGADPGDRDAPCRKDNYPKAGIQQRPAAQGVAQPHPLVRPQLQQNAPNPCSGRTTVFYRLPAGTADAQLLIRRSTDGRIVQELSLDAKLQQRELDLHAYQAGVYFCTLVVNGVVVSTNRMLIQ